MATNPHSPWRDLNLNDEQDQLVESYVRLQMILAGKIRVQLFALVVMVLTTCAGHYVFMQTPDELPWDAGFMSIVQWVCLFGVALGIAFLAFLLQSSKTAEKRLIELPLTPHQVARVAKVGVQAFELALFGREAFRLLTRARAYLKPSR